MFFVYNNYQLLLNITTIRIFIAHVGLYVCQAPNKHYYGTGFKINFGMEYLTFGHNSLNRTISRRALPSVQGPRSDGWVAWALGDWKSCCWNRCLLAGWEVQVP